MQSSLRSTGAEDTPGRRVFSPSRAPSLSESPRSFSSRRPPGTRGRRAHCATPPGPRSGAALRTAQSPTSAARSRNRHLRNPRPSSTSWARQRRGWQTPEAIEHLAAARAAAGDLRARSRIALDLGSALFSAGRAREALEVLEEAITELAGEAPELTRELEYLLIGVARFEPELYPRAQERLERLRELAPQLGPGDEVGLANLASEAARARLERRRGRRPGRARPGRRGAHERGIRTPRSCTPWER